MRNGKILAEGSPDALLQRFQQSSLEGVFLHLCVKDDNTLVGACTVVNNYYNYVLLNLAQQLSIHEQHFICFNL